MTRLTNSFVVKRRGSARQALAVGDYCAGRSGWNVRRTFLKAWHWQPKRIKMPLVACWPAA